MYLHKMTMKATIITFQFCSCNSLIITWVSDFVFYASSNTTRQERHILLFFARAKKTQFFKFGKWRLRFYWKNPDFYLYPSNSINYSLSVKWSESLALHFQSSFINNWCMWNAGRLLLTNTTFSTVSTVFTFKLFWSFKWINPMAEKFLSDVVLDIAILKSLMAIFSTSGYDFLLTR